MCSTFSLPIPIDLKCLFRDKLIEVILPEDILARSIRLLPDEIVEEGQLVDVKVQFNIPVGSHGGIGFLGNALHLFVIKFSHVEEGREEKFQLIFGDDS